ncbi:uncharacterized protein Gasu_64900, partial [Galdieria sulphuraria]
EDRASKVTRVSLCSLHKQLVQSFDWYNNSKSGDAFTSPCTYISRFTFLFYFAKKR